MVDGRLGMVDGRVGRVDGKGGWEGGYGDRGDDGGIIGGVGGLEVEPHSQGGGGHLRKLDGLCDHALLGLIVPALDETRQREVLAHRVALQGSEWSV